ncbi:hypothetical protein GQ42DRAFT_168522 [Ramicandelaber brevisporus]|nr:hypothetical protein GQ42DRAFT_168522 [Ramicandelaber brevisporus]
MSRLFLSFTSLDLLPTTSLTLHTYSPDMNTPTDWERLVQASNELAGTLAGAEKITALQLVERADESLCINQIFAFKKGSIPAALSEATAALLQRYSSAMPAVRCSEPIHAASESHAIDYRGSVAPGLTYQFRSARLALAALIKHVLGEADLAFYVDPSQQVPRGAWGFAVAD